MSGQLATFPPNALNEAIGISVVQDMLINITPERMTECFDTCRSIVVDYKRTISQLVNCIFVAARYQFRRIPFLATLVRSLLASMGTYSDQWKTALLASFTRPSNIHGPRCFFLRELMLAKVLTPAEIVTKIRSVFEYRPSHPEELFISFCWFAPEIQQLDQPLFSHFIAQIANAAADRELSPVFVHFMSIFEYLRASDWKLFHESTSFGFNPDHFIVAIARDEVDQLQHTWQFNSNYLPPACVFDSTEVLNESPSLIHVAAYFGAAKCFDYLLSIGANPHVKTPRGLNLTQFAIIGGSPVLMKRVLEMELDKGGMYWAAAKFHHTALFEYLVANLSTEADTPWQIAFNACAESNNLMLLLKCVDHGISVNLEDIVGVCFSLLRPHS
jgi:hypothetical protein